MISLKKEIKLNLYTLIEFAIFYIIAFIKFACVYGKILPEEYSVIFASISILIIIALYFLLNIFSKKMAKIVSYTFYVFTSLVLMIDSIYFSYNYKFTSITDILLINNLFAVKDSILEINPLKFIWIILDIPFEIIYFIVKNKIYRSITNKCEITFKNLYVFLFVSIYAILLIVYSHFCNFKISYLKNENIIYHLTDILKRFSVEDENFDYSLYTQKQEIVKDENYGIAANKNIIIIQVEALQAFPLNKTYNNQEITPFLNSLKSNNSFYFNNYFYQVGAGNTSDAEFAVNNSLLPTSNNASYLEYYENNYYGLPHILKENGYKEINAFHAYDGDFWNRNIAYVNQGFDNYYSSKDYIQTESIGMGLSDESFLLQVADKINDMEKPFYSFVITLSSHHPFKLPEEKQDINLLEEHQNTLFGNYINAIHYVDNSLELFFNRMKELDLYNDSIFIIYGDHFGIADYNTESAEFASTLIGHNFSIEDMFRVPLIIHVPSMEKETEINTVAGHIDVLPTLLHLLGIENQKSIMLGNDILSVKENIVYEQMHIGSGSFITNDVFFYHSNSGINAYDKAYKLGSYEEIPITQEMLECSKKAIQKLKDAETILKRNLIMY